MLLFLLEKTRQTLLYRQDNAHRVWAGVPAVDKDLAAGRRRRCLVAPSPCHPETAENNAPVADNGSVAELVCALVRALVLSLVVLAIAVVLFCCALCTRCD